MPYPQPTWRDWLKLAVKVCYWRFIWRPPKRAD